MKNGGARVVAGKRRQDPAGDGGRGAVVEGQHDLLVSQIEGARIGFQAHGQAASRTDWERGGGSCAGWRAGRPDGAGARGERHRRREAGARNQPSSR
jgi:hypothetical protein